MPFQSWSNGAMKKKQLTQNIDINNVGIFFNVKVFANQFSD